MVGKRTYRDSLVSGQSARLVAGYIYATAGEGESTTDLVLVGRISLQKTEPFLPKQHHFMAQVPKMPPNLPLSTFQNLQPSVVA